MEILDALWKSRHPYDVLFLSIIEGYTIMESKEYTNRIFYMIGDDILIYHHKKAKYIEINYNLIWSVFEIKFSLGYFEIYELMCVMLKTHLNITGITLGDIVLNKNIYENIR